MYRETHDGTTEAQGGAKANLPPLNGPDPAKRTITVIMEQAVLEELVSDEQPLDLGCGSQEASREDTTLQQQAVELECLLPRLMRRMLTLERDHPATELPLAQLRVCTILQGGARTLSAIGDELNISVSATTQIADRLERAGLVERVCGQDDRRTKKLQLSLMGAEMMRSRREQRTAHAARALAYLAPEQRENALLVLQALMEAVNATVPPAPHEDPLGVRQEQ